MSRIIKKNGEVEKFDVEKIKKAITLSAGRVVTLNEKTKKYIDKISTDIAREYIGCEKDITTNEMHSIVMNKLNNEWPEVYFSYASYRDYRKKMSESFFNAYKESEKVLYEGDKENANKDAALNSTKASLIGTNSMKEYMKAFELDKKYVKAHTEGFIHIHDMAERYLRQFNCCLFDMGGLLKDGFELNGSKYIEPKSVYTAFNVIGDATINASSQQYGGFTIPEIDKVLAPYAEKSYQTHLQNLSFLGELILDHFDSSWNEDSVYIEELMKQEAYERTLREIEQGYQGFETKLNTISNSLGQVPFVTTTFGLETSIWGREISKAILNCRIEGMGATKITAIFPKLVFLHRNEINGNEDSPNRDIFDLSVKCSSKRLYPDYLSLDTGHLGDVYNRTGLAVSPMGCRAYLSPAEDENGNEIYTGRNNIGAVSLNLPKLALETNKDFLENNWAIANDNIFKHFLNKLSEYGDMVFNIHEDYFEKISKTKGSTNPLYFCEGGAWKSVGYDESVESIYKTSTASLGYVGIEEALKALCIPKQYRKEYAIRLVQHLKNLTENAKIKYNHLYALYSTPAESLCYRFQKINQKDYGIIEGVTDKEYMTNSFHIPVWEDISVPEKILYEAPFHQIATGGKITYNEFVNGADLSVLTQAIKFAMKQGLYYGVNVVSATCQDCQHSGDFEEECPICNSKDIIVVIRVCGYLSFSQVKGESRCNPGKQEEIQERVKHKTLRKEDRIYDETIL